MTPAEELIKEFLKDLDAGFMESYPWSQIIKKWELRLRSEF